MAVKTLETTADEKRMRVMAAMSGGVDSSTAVYLLKAQGYECAGITMKLFYNENIGVSKEHTCCSLEDVEDAKGVAYALGIPHYVFNFSDRFQEDVIDRFIEAYEKGRTPNPCIDCNHYMKFGLLHERAKQLGFDYVATGHYAVVEYSEERGRWLLRKGRDWEKDQSYVLYSMTQEQLAHTLFPLGKLTKPHVRKIAENCGFSNAHKHDSQDLCFVPDGRYADFIERHTKKIYPEGDFLDTCGNLLGRHKGIIRYTVGQRKGLGLALKEPGYVCEIDPEKNAVIVGTRQQLYTSEVTVKDINLISMEKIEKPMKMKVKIRYRQPEQWAYVEQTESDTLKIRFEEPQRAVTKGQAAVLYDGDIVAGGGVIT